MWIVIETYFVEPWRAYGPFLKEEDAIEFCAQHNKKAARSRNHDLRNHDWEVMELNQPVIEMVKYRGFNGSATLVDGSWFIKIKKISDIITTRSETIATTQTAFNQLVDDYIQIRGIEN